MSTTETETPAEVQPKPTEEAEVTEGTGEQHEPALDLAGLARLSARAGAVLTAAWPPMDPPVIFTKDAQSALNEFDRDQAGSVLAAMAYGAAVHERVMGEIDDHIRGWYGAQYPAPVAA